MSIPQGVIVRKLLGLCCSPYLSGLHGSVAEERGARDEPMRLSVSVSLLAAAMLFAGGCVAPLPPAKTSPLNESAKAERPVWHVGERWHYKFLHLAQPPWRIDQVVRQEGDGYVIAYTLPGRSVWDQKTVLSIEPDYSGAEDHLTHALALTRGLRRGGPGEYTPPFEWYRWPLEVGKRWTADGIFKTTPPIHALPHQRRDPDQYRVTFAVEAYEEITVPAGRFKAFKIRAQISGVPPLGQLFHDDYVQWYAPAVKRYVRFEFPVGIDRGFAPPEISIRGWELEQFEPAPPQ